MIKLAVIMSVYKNDRLAFLKLAVESILKQTYNDFDFYIQADGLLNHEVDDYLQKHSDPRIIFNKRTENKGLAYSLNELLQRVMAKDYLYIARMDADDISLDNRFARQIEYFEEHPDTNILGSFAIEIDENGNEFFRKKMPVTHQECRDFFIKRDCLIHPTVMFRRDYIEKAGLYSTETFFAEDTKMWQQGFMNGCVFGNVPEYLLLFRLDSNFFNRRSGWSYAKSLFHLRAGITKEMNYGLGGYAYAFLYAAAKMMPTQILSIIYKKAR